MGITFSILKSLFYFDKPSNTLAPVGGVCLIGRNILRVNKLENIKKWFVSLVLGIWATFTENYSIILTFVIVAILLDLATGLVKSKATGEGWSSQKGSKGFWKKIALLVAFGFGVFLDAFIPYALKVVSIDMPFNSPFALVIGAYIILNESISICENLYDTNPHALPKWVKSLLSTANDKINKD